MYVATVVNTLAGIQSIVNRSTLSQLLPPQEIGKKLNFSSKRSIFLMSSFIIFPKPYRVKAGDGISKKYCTTNSGSPEIELMFCPWNILFKF